jgi:hypothetical protein
MGSRYRDLVGDSPIDDLPTVNKRDHFDVADFMITEKQGCGLLVVGRANERDRLTQPEAVWAPAALRMKSRSEIMPSPNSPQCK